MPTAHLLPVSPSMHCSRGGCTCQWGVPAQEGVPAWGCTCWGVYLLGVYLPGEGNLPWGCTCQGGTCPGGVYLPRGCTCQEVYLSGGCTCQRGVPAQVLPPWTEWQTGAKVLPCPKLRLRVVKIWTPLCLAPPPRDLPLIAERNEREEHIQSKKNNQHHETKK